QMAKIGSPRASASRAAVNSQRSRSGSICLSSTEGSRTFWRKNSGEISEPPVSRRPSIWSRRTFRLLAFQTLISGCLQKIGRNHFASFARIQVARFGIGKFATSRRVCKEHVDVTRRSFQHVKRRSGKIERRKQRARDRSSGARFRERFRIFSAW